MKNYYVSGKIARLKIKTENAKQILLILLLGDKPQRLLHSIVVKVRKSV